MLETSEEQSTATALGEQQHPLARELLSMYKLHTFHKIFFNVPQFVFMSVCQVFVGAHSVQRKAYISWNY